MVWEAWFFLSSGLFLGWSLGANDAANVFGTAVGAKMIRFQTAALICSVFLILGAVIAGAGGAHTLGKLGSITKMGAAFTVAFSAAFTVFMMTKLSLPVSTSQAIVGGIIGWNFFAKLPTDLGVVTKIVSTWVACPLLSLMFSYVFYKIITRMLHIMEIPLLRLDYYTRVALILIGAFGSYSLGANNIGNVMGVFIESNPFNSLSVSFITFSSTQVLFLIGGIAIAVGVYTYSKRVMMTVGKSILPLTPVGALVVVFSSALVLFMFSSRGLHNLMLANGLPPIPLVPVSSSQAIVGGVIGVGIAKKALRNMNWSVLINIMIGWVLTPFIAAILAFLLLFIMKNVFKAF